jgi:hypothetical protein
MRPELTLRPHELHHTVISRRRLGNDLVVFTTHSADELAESTIDLDFADPILA